MVKKNALIRKLPSVETLGSTTVICTDKTGTLTLNQMTVRKLFVNDKTITVTGRGYEKTGSFFENEQKIDAKEFKQLLMIGTLCNDAKITEKGVIGDPTEGSLIVSAAKAGLEKDELEITYPRIKELGFDSKRKRMSTLHNIKGKKTVMVKGAPDIVLELCDRILKNGKIERLTRIEKKKIILMNEKLAKQALRVLGFAYKESEVLDEKNLIFVGLQGMIDPPRHEVKEAIAKAKAAGIKVVMITGDFKLTAAAIGRELGLGGKALDAKEIDAIQNLEEHVEEVSIYARVDPRHKVKILEALKARGHIVAMTGDGVNDAPALKKADIGIAMGITGTDVAKEASDMILTDDNFASIVNAIEEGRGIYDNIRKFVQYLLSSNIGEVLTIFIALMFTGFFGNIVPLLPLQILWINLVTDGAPALALGVDPAEPDIMSKKPRNPKENIITKSRAIRMMLVGIVMAAGTLWLFKKYNPALNAAYAQTMAFSVLMMYQMFNVMNSRSEEHSIFEIGVFTNMKLIIAIIASIILQIVVVYVPVFQKVFGTVALQITDWLWIFGIGATILVFSEIVKLIMRTKHGIPRVSG